MQTRKFMIIVAIGLCVIGLIFASVYGVKKFIEFVKVSIETSAGTVTRENYRYSIKNNYKSMDITFTADAWFASANKAQVVSEICDYIFKSDWGAMGVTAQNANQIAIQIKAPKTPVYTHECR